MPKVVWTCTLASPSPNRLSAHCDGQRRSRPINGEVCWKAKNLPHACEIKYCLGKLYLVKDYAWREEDYKVAASMQNYFANFILTGNPNGENLPEWPAATAMDSNPPVMVIDVESKVTAAENDDRYLFLDKAYGNDK